MAKRTLYRSLHPEHSDRLLFAGAAAFALHTAVIIGVGFDVEPREPRQLTSLNVSLVVQPTRDAPDDATDVALFNQRGGNEDDTSSARAAPSPAPVEAPPAPVAQAPPPASAPPGDASATASATAQAPAAAAESVIARETDAARRQTADTPATPTPPAAAASPEPASATPTRRAQATVPAPPEPKPRLDTAMLLAQARSLAATDARRGAQDQASARGPREAVITASTREHRLAAYMEAWRQKVERVGNLNYPDEARRQGITGSLLLDVEIAPSGEVIRLRLLRSSGNRVLDKAAARIVTLAAPFAVFPEEMARDYDVIHIQRTWRFSVVGLKAG